MKRFPADFTERGVLNILDKTLVYNYNTGIDQWTNIIQMLKTFVYTRFVERSFESLIRPIMIRNVERMNHPWPATETRWKVTAHDTINKIITLDRIFPIEILDFSNDTDKRWQLQGSTAGSNVQITSLDWETNKIYYTILRGTFAVNDNVTFWNPFRTFWLNPLTYIVGPNAWATTYVSPGGVWLHSDGQYRMIVNGWDSVHGMTGLYKSSDLLTWTDCTGAFYYHANTHPFDEAWCVGPVTHWTSGSPVKMVGSANYAKAFQGLNAAGRGAVGIVQFDEDFVITSMPVAGIAVTGYPLDATHHYYPGGMCYFNGDLYLTIRYRDTIALTDVILVMKYNITTNACTDIEEVGWNVADSFCELTLQNPCPFVFKGELFVWAAGENSTADAPIGPTNEIYGLYHKRYGTWQPHTRL
jgi:hypothetical protein